MSTFRGHHKKSEKDSIKHKKHRFFKMFLKFKFSNFHIFEILSL